MEIKTTTLVLMFLLCTIANLRAQPLDFDIKLNEVTNKIEQIGNQFKDDLNVMKDLMQDLRGEENFLLSVVSGQQKQLDNKVDLISGQLDSKVGQMSEQLDIKVHQFSKQIVSKVVEIDKQLDNQVIKISKQLDNKMETLSGQQKQLNHKFDQILHFIIENDKKMTTDILNMLEKLTSKVTVLGLKTNIINNRRYYFSTDQPKMTWVEAQYFCRSNKMDLLSLETKSKLDILKPEIKKVWNTIEIWTSGSDTDVEGKWKWTATGSDVHFFVNRDSGFSNNNKYNCLVYKNDAWNDYGCTGDTFHFVCEA